MSTDLFPFLLFVHCLFTILFIVTLCSTLIAFERLITLLIKVILFTGLLYNFCDEVFLNKYK